MRYDSIVNRMEINRLNNAISEEERTISGLFQRIGQTYFAAHKDSPEPSQAGYIRGIQEALERGKHYKEQINRLRGIAICPNPACMAEVPIDSMFCNRCGTRMPAAAAEPEAVFDPNPGVIICASCGNHCAATQKFCNRCGGMLTAPSAAPAPAYTGAAPGYSASAPAYGTPAPEPPAPAYPDPSPAYTAPAPEPPAPAYPDPSPACTAPAPEPSGAFSPMPEPPLAASTAPEAAAFSAVGSPAPSAADPFVPEAEAAPSAPPVPETGASAPSGKKICPNCGTVLAADSLFCLECGQPV